MNATASSPEQIIESLQDYYAQSAFGVAEPRILQPVLPRVPEMAFMFPMASVIDSCPEGIRELASPLSDF
jgi:hypothetical protein